MKQLDNDVRFHFCFGSYLCFMCVQLSITNSFEYPVPYVLFEWQRYIAIVHSQIVPDSVFKSQFFLSTRYDRRAHLFIAYAKVLIIIIFLWKFHYIQLLLAWTTRLFERRKKCEELAQCRHNELTDRNSFDRAIYWRV